MMLGFSIYKSAHYFYISTDSFIFYFYSQLIIYIWYSRLKVDSDFMFRLQYILYYITENTDFN